MAKRSWFKASVRGEVGEIAIYSDIGGFGVTANDFLNQVEALGDVTTLNVRITSDGGDVFQGFAIFNILSRHPANKVVTIDGLAASMASVIAMAGDEIVMPSNAMLMIHNPWGGVVGGSEQIISFGEALDKMRAGILDAYADRTGLKRGVIQKMMDKETWMDAKEAKKLGFADRIEKPVAMAASVNVDRFRNVPAKFGRILKENTMAKTPHNNANDDDALELETPPVKTEKEIRDGILTQHAEVRSLCALAGKSDLADGFIAEDKSPADVLKALDAARVEDAKKTKKPGAADVNARHTPGESDPAAAKSVDPTDVYAKWNRAGKRSDD